MTKFDFLPMDITEHAPEPAVDYTADPYYQLQPTLSPVQVDESPDQGFEVTTSGDGYFDPYPMHFKFEEPIQEEHHQTFHGRERGYMYPVHEEVVHTDPMRDIRGGETFGPEHHIEDMLESYRRVEQEPKDHWVEPVVDEPYDH